MFMHVERKYKPKMIKKFKKVSGTNESKDPWLQETDLKGLNNELVNKVGIIFNKMLSKLQDGITLLSTVDDPYTSSRSPHMMIHYGGQGGRLW